MLTLTKPFRLLYEGTSIRPGFLAPMTGETMVPDGVECAEFASAEERTAFVATLGLVWEETDLAEADESTPTPSAPTLADYEHAVEEVLQECAAAHRYDDIVSACSYAAVENPFQEESAVILAWRGNVWAWCYGLLSNPPSALPTVAEFRASLLAAWPMP